VYECRRNFQYPLTLARFYTLTPSPCLSIIPTLSTYCHSILESQLVDNTTHITYNYSDC